MTIKAPLNSGDRPIKPTYTSIFQKIGVFRKGAEKQVKTGVDSKSGKSYEYEIVGKDLGEKFRFVPDVKDSYKELLLTESIHELCGSSEPTTIRAELVGATAEDVFYGFYTRHKADRKLLIECDGQTISKQYNERTKMTDLVNKPCLNKDDREMHCQDCQPTGKLHIFFPELSLRPVELADGTGYTFYGGFDVLTSSLVDGFKIPEMLEGFELIANSIGETLHCLPVIITRKQTKYSGTDRKPKKKDKGAWVDSPTFMQSYKKEDWFIDIEIDMYRWMQKLAKKGKKPFEIAASSQPVFAPKNQPAIAPAKNIQSLVSPQSKTPSQKFIDVVDSLIAKMTDVDMFIKAEDWIVVQDIYKEDLETQAIVNKKMDTVYKQLTAKNLTEPIAVASQPV